MANLPTVPSLASGTNVWTYVQWLVNQGVSVAVVAYVLLQLNVTIAAHSATITSLAASIDHQTVAINDRCK